MTEPPRKTLSLKKSVPTNESDHDASMPLKRSGKRLIRRDQLPRQTLANTKPPHNSATDKARKPKKVVTRARQAVTSPSDLRVAALDKQLNAAFVIWRDDQPLAVGTDKNIFRFVADHQISASKRVVQKLLRRHTGTRSYLENICQQAQRYTLDGTPASVISQSEKDYAQRQLGVVHSA